MALSNRLERARDALRIAVEDLDDVKEHWPADSDEVAEAQGEVSACENEVERLEREED